MNFAEDIVVTGSRALALRAPRLLLRKPQDFDFVCPREAIHPWLDENSAKMAISSVEEINRIRPKVILRGTPNCEFELAVEGSTAAMLLDLVRNDPATMQTKFGLVPSLDVLFLLKASHRYLKNSPHFWKTLADYHTLKLAGARIRPEHLGFLRMREKETYTYAHPRLNQDKEGFFSGDQITYVYDHDSIHEAVKLFAVPAYTLFQRDGAEVAVDRAKFEALPHDVKLASVVEEATVLAIERSLVPHPGVMDELSAWRYALSKVMTSITSGWWREFAYDNALEVLKRYPAGYWDRFQRCIETGIVRRL